MCMARGRSACWRPWRLFGVDYFTSYFYATGEMMSALHPYGLQQSALHRRRCSSASPTLCLARCTCIRWASSTKAADRTRRPCAIWRRPLSLIVAVTLIQDYVLTIVVSALSGGDQLLSVLNQYGANWIWPFAHRRGAGCGHLVADHSRARRIGAGGLHAAGYLRHDDPDHGHGLDSWPTRVAWPPLPDSEAVNRRRRRWVKRCCTC